MMISTRGRYALRMMLELAAAQGDGWVALADIARRQDISKKYLEQIIPPLNRAGLLQTARGSQGGYRLSRAPEAYTVAEILRATEGTLAPVSCLEGAENDCPRRSECPTLPLWRGLERTVTDYLESVTLAELLAQTGGGDTRI